MQPEYSLSSYSGSEFETRTSPVTHLNYSILLPDYIQLNSEPKLAVANASNISMLITVDMSVYNPSSQDSSDNAVISLFGLINNNGVINDIVVITTSIIYGNNTVDAKEALILSVVEPALDANITIEVSYWIHIKD